VIVAPSLAPGAMVSEMARCASVGANANQIQRWRKEFIQRRRKWVCASADRAARHDGEYPQPT
jgi:transposase-like protein